MISRKVFIYLNAVLIVSLGYSFTEFLSLCFHYYLFALKKHYKKRLIKSLRY